MQLQPSTGQSQIQVSVTSQLPTTEGSDQSSTAASLDDDSAESTPPLRAQNFVSKPSYLDYLDLSAPYCPQEGTWSWDLEQQLATEWSEIKQAEEQAAAAASASPKNGSQPVGSGIPSSKSVGFAVRGRANRLSTNLSTVGLLSGTGRSNASSIAGNNGKKSAVSKQPTKKSFSAASANHQPNATLSSGSGLSTVAEGGNMTIDDMNDAGAETMSDGEEEYAKQLKARLRRIDFTIKLFFDNGTEGKGNGASEVLLKTRNTDQREIFLSATRERAIEELENRRVGFRKAQMHGLKESMQAELDAIQRVRGLSHQAKYKLLQSRKKMFGRLLDVRMEDHRLQHCQLAQELRIQKQVLTTQLRDAKAQGDELLLQSLLSSKRSMKAQELSQSKQSDNGKGDAVSSLPSFTKATPVQRRESLKPQRDHSVVNESAISDDAGHHLPNTTSSTPETASLGVGAAANRNHKQGSFRRAAMLARIASMTSSQHLVKGESGGAASGEAKDNIAKTVDVHPGPGQSAEAKMGLGSSRPRPLASAHASGNIPVLPGAMDAPMEASTMTPSKGLAATSPRRKPKRQGKSFANSPR